MFRPSPFSRFMNFMALKRTGAQVGEYKSRGKGKHRSKLGKKYEYRSKYVPHQGEQEIARRLRQAAKLNQSNE